MQKIPGNLLHADSHGQSESIFGLAFLLGIKMMPRIKGWKHLAFYRPSKNARYEHIDDLFSYTIDWNLIATHLPDILRIVLSIRAGRISPSAILRRLSTYSRKNRLYQAFAELGRAVRTTFLLRYWSDQELRITITAALNKKESFNHFIKWAGFGKGGVITENDRDEQRKIIKYTHVLANMLIFYNVAMTTRIVHQLAQEGFALTPEDIATLSPYLTEHTRRFQGKKRAKIKETKEQSGQTIFQGRTSAGSAVRDQPWRGLISGCRSDRPSQPGE